VFSSGSQLTAQAIAVTENRRAKVLDKIFLIILAYCNFPITKLYKKLHVYAGYNKNQDHLPIFIERFA
jgi:hypothetical protein